MLRSFFFRETSVFCWNAWGGGGLKGRNRPSLFLLPLVLIALSCFAAASGSSLSCGLHFGVLCGVKGSFYCRRVLIFSLRCVVGLWHRLLFRLGRNSTPSSQGMEVFLMASSGVEANTRGQRLFSGRSFEFMFEFASESCMAARAPLFALSGRIFQSLCPVIHFVLDILTLEF